MNRNHNKLAEVDHLISCFSKLFARLMSLLDIRQNTTPKLASLGVFSYPFNNKPLVTDHRLEAEQIPYERTKE